MFYSSWKNNKINLFMKTIVYILPIEDVVSIVKEALLIEQYDLKEAGFGVFQINKGKNKGKIKIANFQIDIIGSTSLVDACYTLILSKLQIYTTTRFRRMGKCNGVNCTCGMCEDSIK